VDIPPLSRRKEDIFPLARHFLEHFCRKYNHIKVLSSSVVDLLNEYDWPGNVRELRNLLERMIIMSPESELEISSMPAGSFEDAAVNDAMTDVGLKGSNRQYSFERDFSFHAYMDQCEKDIVCRALESFNSPKKAAEALGIDLSNVYRKMQKHKISVKA
jgi:DNA-binding NtrC family response regulator